MDSHGRVVLGRVNIAGTGTVNRPPLKINIVEEIDVATAVGVVTTAPTNTINLDERAYRLAKLWICYELLRRTFPEENEQVFRLLHDLIIALLRGDISLH
jgi:hypothetical protein